ncbi:MAG TPA: sulfite exporter TauE/SafE family protein [Candidatus Thermoplasmatota archaeon]|nr:sulfite exporter TauE/SafE family protein [Candidatus Thermoplasmatota archaeon]
MTPFSEAAMLFVAAMIGGGLNAVAGGGSFFTFPALLLSGVAPIEANATSAAALWPASVAGARSYRGAMRHEPRLLLALAGASVAGGLAGALVLLGTPQDVFRELVPWLLLLATLVFAGAPLLLRRLRGHSRPRALSGPALLGFSLVWFGVATYGGYFGGGMGFLMLGTLAAMGMEDVHAMNGLKLVMGAALNAVAIVAFVVAGRIVWLDAGLMAVGGVLGAVASARHAQRVDPAKVRAFVVAAGALLTVYFFVAR